MSSPGPVLQDGQTMTKSHFWQDIRKFSKLAAGCNLDDQGTVAPPAVNMPSYDEAIANSCTDTYTVGSVVAKADGE
jgi:hypothetical protein